MALTAFTRSMGTAQGRLELETAVDGTHVFVLGSEEPGRYENLEPNDFVDVKQDVDLTGLRMVRVHLRFATPASVPAGYRWKAALRIGGVEMAATYGRPGRTRDILDMAANVDGMNDTREVAVRLQLVEE